EGLHAPRHQHHQLRHGSAAGAGRDLRRGRVSDRAAPSPSLAGEGARRPHQTLNRPAEDETQMAKDTMGSFNWADPFLLDDQLTDDERMIRDTARAYAQEKLLPRVLEAYAHEKTDRAIFNEMGELGLLGVTIPEEFGGAGASYV